MERQYTSEQIVEAFQTSSNVNAALKSFLKREVQRGAPSERFVKSMKKVLASKDSERMANFFEKHLEEFEPHIMILAGYAHSDAVTSISEGVVEQYADKFNETYEVTEDSIKVTDKESFKSILRSSREHFSKQLKEAELPQTNFMLSVLAYSLFEDQVLPEALRVMFEQD